MMVRRIDEKDDIGDTYVFSDLDRVPSPPRKKYTVSGLHVRRDDLAIFVRCTWANSDDSCLGKRAVSRRRGQNYPSSRFLQNV